MDSNPNEIVGFARTRVTKGLDRVSRVIGMAMTCRRWQWHRSLSGFRKEL